MKPEQIQQVLERAGAVRHGHFILSSGRHSATYVQCALVLCQPQHAETLGRALAKRFAGVEIDLVVSLALGGLIIGQEVARALGVPALFVERDSSGRLALRREFEIAPGRHVLVVEDVWTTGKSTREAMEVVQGEGGRVVALGALVDRSGGRLAWELPAHALLEIDIPNYESDDCPLCRAGDMPIRPGSRFERKSAEGDPRSPSAPAGERGSPQRQ